MSVAFLSALPSFGSLVLAVAYLAAGVGVGVLFFRGLWWNARLIVSGGSPATVLALGVGRFALLGGLLTCAALQGAAPLIGAAVGVLAGRFLVLRSLARSEL